jgi:hypothetical protein
MATRKKTANKTVPASKTKQPKAQKAARRKVQVEEAVQAQAEPARDPRLPAVGTVLQKRDRAGNVRCECVVEDGGIRYDKTLFKSLSAAAKAAAEDLKIKGNQNGYVFWQLVKPAGSPRDQIARLENLWERYVATARAVVAGAAGDKREEALAAIERHRGVDLVREAA